jgi:hypothetical protein
VRVAADLKRLAPRVLEELDVFPVSVVDPPWDAHASAAPRPLCPCWHEGGSTRADRWRAAVAEVAASIRVVERHQSEELRDEPVEMTPSSTRGYSRDDQLWRGCPAGERETTIASISSVKIFIHKS